MNIFPQLAHTKGYSACFSLALTAMALLLPKVHLGQAPPLGTADTYALFTAVGGFDNTGSTIVTGDIGAGAGAFTGFPPGTLIGASHFADAAAVQAATDVTAAYLAMSSNGCGVTLTTPMGSGQVLTPNVYCTTTATALNGNLRLDALNDPNAVFIFRIDGALTTGTSSNIVLENLAQLCNVYWQVNGAFDLGNGSVFKGNMLANGAINLLAGATLEGRGLSKAGAITLANNVVSMTCPITSFPIELLAFSASCADGQQVLTWSTASETNNDYFAVMGSNDGIRWEKTGEVDGAGNSSEIRAYSFGCEGNMFRYFRLRQVDFNQQTSQSKIIKVDDCTTELARVAVYPNPSNGTLHVLAGEDAAQFVSLAIYNTSGIRIFYTTTYEPVIALDGYQPGLHVVRLIMTAQVVISRVMLLPE